MKKAQYFYLLRRGFFSGGGLDSDYKAVLAEAEDLGYTAPSRSQQLLQSNLVKALKNAGVWDKLDLLYVMAGEQENFARLNWKAPASFELANSGTPTFTSNKGFSNGGGSNYLDTTFNFSTDGDSYTLNDAGTFVAFPIMSTTSETNNRVYGNEEPTSANFLSPRIDVDGSSSANRNWINGSDYQDPTTALDFHKDKHTIFFQNRTDASTANYRSTDLTIDDVKSAEDTASNSSSLLNDNLVLLQSKGAYLESTATIGLFGLGSSLTAVEMAAVETAYYDNYYLEVVNAPVNTVAPAISGTAERGETLTATTGTWSGTGTLSYAYQWTRDGVDISGANASTYTLVADDDNADIYCSVIAIDDEGSASADSNTLGPVLGEPTLLVAPVASGTPEVDQVLSTTDGTWQGKPTITITYQWRRNTVNISGATSSTYTLVSADLNALVDCQVTATNSIRSTSADTNDLGPIEAAPVIPAAPSISGVPTIAGTAKVGETLTATAASATGEPTPTTSWQWERSDNGTTGWASISGATSNTYTAVSADESKYLRVVQTETNTEGSDSANSAATAQVAAAFDYLLDDYSGAAAAYSLRLLDSTYSGNAIKVRRASDNTEQDIGFSNNELDTSSLESFCSGTDGFITTWYDQSGNANSIVVSTASQQPKIVSSGSTITDGGKASITLDEQFSQSLEIPIAASSTQDLFQVHKTNDTSFILFRDTLSTARYVWAATDGSTSNVLTSNYGTPSLFVNGTSQNPQNRDALNSLLSTNNQVLMSSIGGDSSAFTGNIRWGYYSSSFIYDGNVQEIIFYNSDQSSNRSGIETNINNYYSIY